MSESCSLASGLWPVGSTGPNATFSMAPTDYHFTLPAGAGSAFDYPTHTAYPGVAVVVPSVSSARTSHGSDGIIRAIIVHATAGTSTAGAMTRLFERAASWHWIIPHAGESAHGQWVWSCIPEPLAAWHVLNACSNPIVNGGKNFVNTWAIGIEIVNSQDPSHPDPFSD